jgi:hypothetical protein
VTPRWVGLAAALTGCSTLAPPQVACDEQNPCKQGQVCNDGTCYDDALPARDLIALDVSSALEGGFRVELRGNDASVRRILDERPYRFRAGLGDREDGDDLIPGVRDRLSLLVEETFAVDGDDQTAPLPATLTLTQPSRLRRDPTTAALQRFDPLSPEGEPVAQPEVVVPWAHYEPQDEDGSRPLVVLVNPDDTKDAKTNSEVYRGLVYRQLVRPQSGEVETHAFTIPTRRECHRKLHGTVRILGDMAPPDVAVELALVHARGVPTGGEPVCELQTGTPAVCSPDTVLPNAPPSCTNANQCPAPYGCHDQRCGCASDDECPEGQICEVDTHRCALDLVDLPATKGGVGTRPGEADFDAWVYTYCEDAIEMDRELEFVVRAAPQTAPDQRALPPLNFRVRADFLWQDGKGKPVELSPLCFPPWAPPQRLAVVLQVAPQELYRDDGGGVWTCCATDCFDQGAPPPTPAACPVATSLSARTTFAPDLEQWSAASCVDLDSAPDSPGGQTVTSSFDLATCVAAGDPCEIALTRGEDSLAYELRIEPPVGSLVRSMVFPVPQVVDAATTALAPPPLAYRVLLRGQAALEDADGCKSTPGIDPSACTVDAEILAERLRVPGDEDPALGPFFYTARTIPGSDGDFVLPVNPGVYVLTALPRIRSPGGPAAIRVVDLRLGAPAVDVSGPIPVADLDEPIVLENGQFVTFELTDFDSSTVAVPLDMASWKQLRFGDQPLDLGDPDTCHSATPRGCSIRRLRPGNSGLSLTQERFAKFVTRKSGE